MQEAQLIFISILKAIIHNIKLKGFLFIKIALKTRKKCALKHLKKNEYIF